MAPSLRSSVILTPPTPSSPQSSRTLIFFVPGNPGVVAYYVPFLKTLFELLSSSPTRNTPHIHAHSLPGFGIPSQPPTAPLYSLQQTIILTYAFLQMTLNSRDTQFTNVILIGHSVGAYICMELLRRASADPSALAPRNMSAILLFPTLTHIAQSSSGTKITPLLAIPAFPRLVGAVAPWICALIPAWLVALVTGMRGEKCGHALEATVEWLRTTKGVWQALHLAKYEMKEIKEDKWDDSLWGTDMGRKLVLYFGTKDHWVADHTRDALIASRGVQRNSSKASSSTFPKLLIDRDQIPHGFCIKHSEMVAEKVKIWVDEIIGEEENE